MKNIDLKNPQPQDIPALIAMLENPSCRGDEALAVVVAIHKLQASATAAIPILQTKVNDYQDTEFVRATCLITLDKIDRPSIKSVLFKASSDPSAHVRQCAYVCIHGLITTHPNLSEPWMRQVVERAAQSERDLGALGAALAAIVYILDANTAEKILRRYVNHPNESFQADVRVNLTLLPNR